MNFVVTLDLTVPTPLSEDQIQDLIREGVLSLSRDETKATLVFSKDASRFSDLLREIADWADDVLAESLLTHRVDALMATTEEEADRRFDMADELISTYEIAKILGCSPSMVIYLSRKPEFPPPLATSGAFKQRSLWSRQEIEEYRSAASS